MKRDTRTPHQIAAEVAKAMEAYAEPPPVAAQPSFIPINRIPADTLVTADMVRRAVQKMTERTDLDLSTGLEQSAISRISYDAGKIKVERIEPTDFYCDPRGRSAEEMKPGVSGSMLRLSQVDSEKLDALLREAGLRRPVWALALNTPLFKASWERMCLLAYIDFAASDYGIMLNRDASRIWNAIAQHIPGASGRS